MRIPNIPSVITSIVDKSYLEPVLNQGRCVLIPYFSKYGKEQFHYIYPTKNTITNEIYQLGQENSKKYGYAVKYIKSVLSVPNTRVLGYRLMPSDATYANFVIGDTTDNGDYNTYSKENIHDIKVIVDETKKEFAIFAQGRGEGYHDIVIRIVPDYEMELNFADDDGNPLVKFNFFMATIYEIKNDGLVELESNIRFSLIDSDENGQRFINPQNGQDLFVNNVFKKYTDFVDMKITEKLVDAISQYKNILDVPNRIPVIKDKNTGNIYKLYKDKNNKLRYVRISETSKIISDYDKDTNGNIREELYIKYGNDKVAKVYINNKVLTIEDDTSGNEGVDYYVIDGDVSFYKFKITDDLKYNIDEEFEIERSKLAKLLTKDSYIKLQNGSDGENLHPNGRFNLNGPGDLGKENAKQLLVDFYLHTYDLYDVIFPKWTFDYVVDYTGDDDVKGAINHLTENVGLFLGIVSAPYSINADKDIEWREDIMYQSNMHLAIYSGQVNSNHYDEETGSDIGMRTDLYALLKHLEIDYTYSITEPVANIVKGQLPVSGAELSYNPSALEIEDLMKNQINAVAVERDGKYFITQLTAYRKNSKLTRINNVKTLHKIRKDLPPLLKDLLQNKANKEIISTAKNRVQLYMDRWIIREGNTSDGIFTDVQVVPHFDESSNTLYIYLYVIFVGIIEKISIPIIVR